MRTCSHSYMSIVCKLLNSYCYFPSISRLPSQECERREEDSKWIRPSGDESPWGTWTWPQNSPRTLSSLRREMLSSTGKASRRSRLFSSFFRDVLCSSMTWRKETRSTNSSLERCTQILPNLQWSDLTVIVYGIYVAPLSEQNKSNMRLSVKCYEEKECYAS